MDKLFEWSEVEDMEEDRQMLLTDFKRDLATADPINARDLEKQMIPKKHV